MREWVARTGTSVAQRWRDDPLDVAMCAGTLILLAGLLVHFLEARQTIGSDQAMYLNIGRSLREGGLPYVDVVEVNPPLIGYLSLVPLVIADVFGLPVIPVFNVSVFVLVAISAWAIHRLARRAWGDRVASATVLAFAIANGLVVQIQSWGQRDHLFVALALPLILLGAAADSARPVGRGARIAIGVAAALGAPLKPGFFVIVVGLEVIRAVRRRSAPRRAEHVAFAVASVVYAASLVVVPSVRREGLGRWIPQIARSYLPAYGESLGDMARPALWLGTLFVVVMVAEAVHWLRGLRRAGSEGARGAGSDPARLFALLAISALAYYATQTGWPYQLIPFQMFALLSIAASLIGWQARRARLSPEDALPTTTSSAASAPARPNPSVAGGRIAAVAVMVVALVGAAAIVRRSPAWGETSPVLEEAIHDLSSPGDRVAVISTSSGEADHAFLVLDRRYGSRFPWTFPIAFSAEERGAAHPYPTRGRLTHDEAAFVRDLEHDLLHRRTRLVLIEGGGCEGCPPGFRIQEWIRRSGLQRWLDQHYVRRPDRFPWTVYVRGN